MSRSTRPPIKVPKVTRTRVAKAALRLPLKHSTKFVASSVIGRTPVSLHARANLSRGRHSCARPYKPSGPRRCVMSAKYVNNPEHWRERAVQMRTLSDWIEDARRRRLCSSWPTSISRAMEVANYCFPRTWPGDREQRDRIIGDWLRAEARFLA